MLSNRRDFLGKMGIATAAGIMSPSFLIINPVAAAEVKAANEKVGHLSPEEVAMDEEYWKSIQRAYTVSPNIINLNNAGVSPQTFQVQEMLDKYVRTSNEAPSYFMWRELDMGREPLREKLAALAGCSPEEIAINRNATEALETIIFGLNLKEGDEVVLSKQDYPNMMNAWKLREKRHGIKLVWLDLDLPNESDEYFVNTYSSAVTDKTKVVYITHCINWNGQFVPVRKMADAVRKKNPNAEVVCDTAQSFCHVDFSYTDLGVDYSGTSLHKWLCAPFGSGMMYVKKDKIKNIWPLFANDKPDSTDIRKFEALGTRSFPIEQAIGYAINFHNEIGSARKEARLRYLKNYWSEQVKDVPRVKLYTSLKKEYSCGIGSFYVEGETLQDIDKKLWEKYKIHAVGITIEHFKHIRVSPQVYTTLYDLDKLVRCIKDIAVNGGK